MKGLLGNRAPTLEEHTERIRTLIGAIDAIRVLYEEGDITAERAMAHIANQIKTFGERNA